jgi:hypothetical protein
MFKIINKDLVFSLKFVKYSFIHITKFFDLYYYSFNYYSMSQFTGNNNLKNRNSLYKFADYTGFKIQCLGRFSRNRGQVLFDFH